MKFHPFMTSTVQTAAVIACLALPVLGVSQPTWTAPAALNSYAFEDLAFDRTVSIASGDGTMVASWAAVPADNATAPSIMTARSEDNGLKWNQAIPLPSPQAGIKPHDGLYRPQVFYMGSGQWQVVWYANTALGTESSVTGFSSRSADNGITWSIPEAGADAGVLASNQNGLLVGAHSPNIKS